MSYIPVAMVDVTFFTALEIKLSIRWISVLLLFYVAIFLKKKRSVWDESSGVVVIEWSIML